MSEYLSPHFTLHELGGEGAPAWIQQALGDTAQLLETVRAILGVPLTVTSGYRSEQHNLEVGGAASSQHVDGSAADVVPAGLSHFTSYGLLTNAMQRGTLQVGQLIFYTDDRHIHIGRPTRTARNQVLVKVGRLGDDYRLPTADVVALLPGSPVGAAGTIGVLGALGLIALTLTGKKARA